MSSEHSQELAEPGAADAKPRIDGRYTRLLLLGRGGMAEVFRVRDEVTGRELALKRLRPERAAQGDLPRAQFEREFHTLSQLDHPCVIRVYDYVVGAEGAYYTMELLDGEDLRHRDALPWVRVCQVLGDLSSVLALLHSRRWLHRDLSPRNVLSTRDGSTKLIDFGAMAPMGVCRAVVGTPPYVPPEALQQLSLDGRADLFAFGALAYRLLTGRNAYPARHFTQLPDIWRTRPAAPGKLVPEIPAALSALVMELISLERGARPGTASEVIERLDAIGGPPARPRPDVRASYLATPRLVGRERALVRSRRHLVRSLQGHGAGILLEGPPGVGRSRFLDVCVLEAKLLGAAVLRADGSDAARGDYGVARSLGEQLLSTMPDLALQAARLLQPVLATLLPALADPIKGAAAQEPAPERRHLQTALRDWFRNVARNKRVMIAVDDLDRIDEPSAALLASLAHRCERRKLIVVATVQSAALNGPAMELFAQIAERVQLQPLSADETEQLLRSVFAGAGDLAPLAQYVHGLAHGNPRQVMQLAMHLVASGEARYAGGSWIVPERLSGAQLPASIDAALSARVSRLQGDALTLARALALTDPTVLSLEDYAGLLPDGSHARAFDALSQLVAANILEAEGERYRFTHARWSDLLSEGTPADARAALHGRLVPLAPRFRFTVELPFHLMQCGEHLRAIQLLIESRENGRLTPTVRSIRLHAMALELADRLDLPARTRLQLRLGMVMVSALLGEVEVFREHVENVLAALEEAAGVREFNAADDLETGPRALRALMRAKARHDALPEHERTFDPPAALRELAWLQIAFASISRITLDGALCHRLPALRAFAPNSELVSIMDRGAEGLKLLHAGQMHRSYRLKRATLERVLERHAQLAADPMHVTAIAGLIAVVGSEDAAWARAQAEEHVTALLAVPKQRSSAWRVRAIYSLMLGNAIEARQCQRRAQLLSLQDHTKELPPNFDLVSHAIGYWLSDDLNGLKQLTPQVEALAARYPKWQVIQDLVRCHHLRLSGDLPAALALAEACVLGTPPCTHVASCWVASAVVALLDASGQVDAAAQRGLEYQQAFEAHGCELGDCFDLARATALALAKTGQTARAIALADAVIADLEQKEVGGVLLGCGYETRARIAQLASDAAGFERWAKRCGELYQAHDNPALTAKYARLLPHQRGEDPAASESLRRAFEQAAEADPYQATEWSRMAECVDASERAQCALKVILEQFGASEGHLYGPIEGRLMLLASVPQSADDPALLDFMESRLQLELASEETTGSGGKVARKGADALHRRYRIVLLSVDRDGETLATAIAAVSRDGQRDPDRHVLAILAESLIEHDDVDPLTQMV